MKLPVDTSAIAFLCAVEAEPVVDFETKRPTGGRERRAAVPGAADRHDRRGGRDPGRQGARPALGPPPGPPGQGAPAWSPSPGR